MLGYYLRGKIFIVGKNIYNLILPNFRLFLRLPLSFVVHFCHRSRKFHLKLYERTRMLRNTLFLKVVISCLLGFCLLVIRISRSSVQLQQDPVEFQKTDIYNKLSQLRNKYVVQEEERNFPIAFSLVIYRDIDRAIRLLRAIYRPHNYYCIHVDKKANPAYFEAIQKAIRRIGSNVFLIPDSERISIVWGYLSTLDADLACAKRLLEFSSTWRYWINLTGHEFPLRTNWELVRALKAVRGANLVAGFRDVRDFGRLPPPSITPEGVSKLHMGDLVFTLFCRFMHNMFRHRNRGFNESNKSVMIFIHPVGYTMHFYNKIECVNQTSVGLSSFYHRVTY